MRFLTCVLLAPLILSAGEPRKKPVVFMPEVVARTHVLKSVKAIVPGDMARCDAAVVLEARIGRNGNVEWIQSLSGNSLLISSAIQALKDLGVRTIRAEW